MLYQNCTILESCRDNNGARTVLSCILDAYASVAPHMHTRFSESFFVEYGSLELWNGFGKVLLELAQGMSIAPHTLHHYVAGKSGARITVTLEPGNLAFEQAVLIVQGIRRDAAYSQRLANNDPVLLAVLAELTDFNPPEGSTEPNAVFMNAPEVIALKRELMEKFQF